MVSDRDVTEENATLLMRRWRHVTSRAALNDPARLGMDPTVTAELRALDEIQVMRAADCSAPLFRFSQPDDVVTKVLQPDTSHEFAVPLRDAVDAIVEEENHVFLMNRWSAARVSVVHSQCLLGLSTRVIDVLRNATVNDIRQAASRGIRLAKLSPKANYLFHAGRNISMQRSNRTFLAVCAGSGLAH